MRRPKQHNVAVSFVRTGAAAKISIRGIFEPPAFRGYFVTAKTSIRECRAEPVVI